MEDKKRLTILVIIALVLAITAIALNTMSSDVPTSTKTQGLPTGAVIGIDILPAPVEDKLTENENQPQQ
jgi:hypothetical protein